MNTSNAMMNNDRRCRRRAVGDVGACDRRPPSRAAWSAESTTVGHRRRQDHVRPAGGEVDASGRRPASNGAAGLVETNGSGHERHCAKWAITTQPRSARRQRRRALAGAHAGLTTASPSGGGQVVRGDDHHLASGAIAQGLNADRRRPRIYPRGEHHAPCSTMRGLCDEEAGLRARVSSAAGKLPRSAAARGQRQDAAGDRRGSYRRRGERLANAADIAVEARKAWKVTLAAVIVLTSASSGPTSRGAGHAAGLQNAPRRSSRRARRLQGLDGDAGAVACERRGRCCWSPAGRRYRRHGRIACELERIAVPHDDAVLPTASDPTVPSMP